MCSLVALKNGLDFIYTDPTTSPRRFSAVNNKNVKPDTLKRNSKSWVNFETNVPYQETTYTVNSRNTYYYSENQVFGGATN